MDRRAEAHWQAGETHSAGKTEEKRQIQPSHSALVCVAVTMETCLPLPGNRWFEDYELRNRWVPQRPQIRRNPTGERAAVGAWGRLALALPAAARQIAAAQTGAGFVGRPRGGPGWGLAAEKEVEVDGFSQVLAGTMAGLITEECKRRMDSLKNTVFL